MANPSSSERGPLRRGYLARSPLLIAGLSLFDAVLRLRPGSRREAAGVPGTPRRVLLALGGQLGDAVIASSLLPRVRAEWPEAEIGVLAGSWAAPVLRDHPLVAHWHAVDHWKSNRGARGLAERLGRHLETRRVALAEIRALRYDLAIDVYPFFPNSAPLLWRAGIPVRVGFTSGGFGPLLTHPAEWEDSDRHLAEIQASLIDRVAARTSDAALRYALPERALSAERLPAGLRPRSYLALHLGAGLALKEWPAGRWRELVARLVAEGHHLVFTGTGGDQAEKVRAAIADQPRCVSLCDQLSWPEFVSTLSNARLVVSVDSVAGHLAAAAGTPVVVLMSGMNRIPQWQPLADRVAVVSHAVPCAPCHTSWGCEAMSCVREIAVAEVLAAVHAQLGADDVNAERSKSLSGDEASLV